MRALRRNAPAQPNGIEVAAQIVAVEREVCVDVRNAWPES
jgi:hypothetical protein